MAEPVPIPGFSVADLDALGRYAAASTTEELAGRIYKAIGQAYRDLGAVDHLAFFHEHIDEDVILSVLPKDTV